MSWSAAVGMPSSSCSWADMAVIARGVHCQYLSRLSEVSTHPPTGIPACVLTLAAEQLLIASEMRTRV